MNVLQPAALRMHAFWELVPPGFKWLPPLSFLLGRVATGPFVIVGLSGAADADKFTNRHHQRAEELRGK